MKTYKQRSNDRNSLQTFRPRVEGDNDERSMVIDAIDCIEDLENLFNHQLKISAILLVLDTIGIAVLIQN